MVYESRGRKSPYFPTFYGDLKGLYTEKGSAGKKPYLAFDISSKMNHQSLVTLEFVADSVSFVDSR